MRHQRTSAILWIAVGVMAQTALCAAALAVAPKSDAALEAQCERYFREGCSEAMGRWLPRVAYEDALAERATHVDAIDGFAYGNARPPSLRAMLESIGPADGTFFVYGETGPPRGRAVYDRVHRVAYYGQGCCSWKEAVVAANVAAPPKTVVERDLSTLTTLRGVRLNQTVSQVMALNGKATEQFADGHSGLSVLTYTTRPPASSAQYRLTPCGQTQRYFFRTRHLILIQLENAC